jgi:hypothetical protein
MKSKLSLGSAAVCLWLITAPPAHALKFNWSFDVTESNDGSGPALGTGSVTGTIDGLVEGDNDGSAVTIQVISSPGGNLLGGGWNLQSFGPGVVAQKGFNVSGGVVTLASAGFERNGYNEQLFFGDSLAGNFFPELGRASPYQDYRNVGGAVVYTRIDDPVSTPGPLPLFGVAAAFGFSRKLRNRIKVTRTTVLSRAAG